jgi:hypothetical protein
VSIACTILLILLPRPLPVFGGDGLIKVITGILQILTGFYIASLAAVATFDKQGMDDPMPGKPIALNVKRRGHTKSEILTRRRFLCLLFGYLALLSFFLYFLGAIANLVTDNVKYLLPVASHSLIKWGFVFAYLFLTVNLVTTTLHGLYYMVDRIHRADAKIVENE